MRTLIKNNKGFSLVELIAAVAILAVVVTPLLHSFVTSTKISYRATEINQTTLAAKNILEAVDARPISEYQEISDSNLASQLLSDSDNTVKIMPIGKFNYLGNLETDNGDFVIGLQNLKVGSSTYDAKVEFTRGDKEASYTDANGATIKSTSNGLFLINDEEIAKYSGMDAVFSQSYIKTANPDLLVEEAYATQKKMDDANRVNAEQTGSGTVFNFLPNRKNASRQRVIELTVIKKDDGLIYATITYSYTFTYTYIDGTGRPQEGSWGGLNNSNTRFKYSLFPGGYQPKNKDGSISIYIMYYPETQKNVEDRIIINNFGYDSYDVNMKVFLYKQFPMNYDEETNKYTESTSFPSDGTYRPYIRIYKPESFEIYNDDEAEKRETLIYTNIDQGMPDGTSPNFAVANVDVDPEEFIHYDPDDPDSVLNITHGWVNNNYADSFSLVRKENDIRIYNIKVSLYKKGSFVPNTVTGSVTVDGINYTTVDTKASSFTGKPIYVVEGSKTP